MNTRALRIRLRFDRRKTHLVTCSGVYACREDAMRIAKSCENMGLRSFSHGYGESNYYIVLVPKYRRKIFKDIHVVRGCRMVFYEIADQYGYKIIALEIIEDHVHLFLGINPTHSFFRTFQLFKGISARKLFWRFPNSKK